MKINELLKALLSSQRNKAEYEIYELIFTQNEDDCQINYIFKGNYDELAKDIVTKTEEYNKEIVYFNIEWGKLSIRVGNRR